MTHTNTDSTGEIEFPYTYSKGSISVKIYRTPTRGNDSYTLVYWKDGKRQRPTFNKFEKALAEAKDVVRLLGSTDVDVLELKSADKAAYQRALILLEPLGVSLEFAAAEYAHARQLLGNVPFSMVVEFFL